MPQASDKLRERWHCDVCAFEQLGMNFKVTKGGIIKPKKNYSPSKVDYSAIEYLVCEWDYGYEE